MRALPNCWISERIAVTVLLSGIRGSGRNGATGHNRRGITAPSVSDLGVSTTVPERSGEPQGPTAHTRVRVRDRHLLFIRFRSSATRANTTWHNVQADLAYNEQVGGSSPLAPRKYLWEIEMERASRPPGGGSSGRELTGDGGATKRRPATAASPVAPERCFGGRSLVCQVATLARGRPAQSRNRRPRFGY